MRLPRSGAPAVYEPKEKMRVLIDKGLKYPQGIAVDDYREFLYVADPALGKLVRYRLSISGDTLVVGRMHDVASPVEVRAVAVDGLGNIWFTDEGSQKVMRVTAQQAEQGHRTPQTVYSSTFVEQVRSPGGIAVDNFFVYWLNKADGRTTGSLIKAVQNPSESLLEVDENATAQEGQVHALARNSDKCYGVCMALGNVFFTDDFRSLYAVPRNSVARSEVVNISSSFVEPRGCSFDGDGTVYVADKGGNSIYQFASNMEHLKSERPMTKAAELQGPFGVAVYSQLDNYEWN